MVVSHGDVQLATFVRPEGPDACYLVHLSTVPHSFKIFGKDMAIFEKQQHTGLLFYSIYVCGNFRNCYDCFNCNILDTQTSYKCDSHLQKK